VKAQEWSAGKNLSVADYRFLAASQQFDADQVFAAAQRKSNRRILLEIAVAGVAFAIAGGSGIFAQQRIQTASQASEKLALAEARLKITNVRRMMLIALVSAPMAKCLHQVATTER
jgi:hypothetical protein